MLKEDKNKNGKRSPKTHIIGKNAKNISKKKYKLERLQEVPVKNSQEAGL
jgi:hypothetical protein